MRDQKKLHISPSDERDLNMLWDEMDRLQKQCKDILLHNMKHELPGTVINNLNYLQFEEYLADSTIDRSTKVGIFCDDLQKFARFKSAVELATKSTSGEKVETLSDQLESVLFTFTSLMRRVLQKNDLPVPHPQELDNLKDQLDKKTREFLKFFVEASKESTDGGKITESAVDDVRNYVVMRTLYETLLLFKEDLGHLIE